MVSMCFGRPRLMAHCTAMWGLVIAASSAFGVVFVAELGDKTQLATFLYAADTKCPRHFVFLGAAAALLLATAIAVLVGGMVSKHVNTRYLSWAAGAGFVLIGIWTIYKA